MLVTRELLMDFARELTLSIAQVEFTTLSGRELDTAAALTKAAETINLPADCGPTN